MATSRWQSNSGSLEGCQVAFECDLDAALGLLRKPPLCQSWQRDASLFTRPNRIPDAGTGLKSPCTPPTALMGVRGTGAAQASPNSRGAASETAKGCPRASRDKRNSETP